jgi:hypothetical protein
MRHLKTETRLRGERFESVMGVFYDVRRTSCDGCLFIMER